MTVQVISFEFLSAFPVFFKDFLVAETHVSALP